MTRPAVVAWALAGLLSAACTPATSATDRPPSTPATVATGSEPSAASAEAAAARTPSATVPPPASAGPATPSARSTAAPVGITVGGPQRPGALAGLDAAGTVVEYPLSSGTSGLFAVVGGTPGAVGPVRAATPSDPALAIAFAVPLVTARATTDAAARLRAADLGVVEEADPGGALVRDPARRAPFNLYAVPSLVRAALGSNAPDVPPSGDIDPGRLREETRAPSSAVTSAPDGRTAAARSGPASTAGWPTDQATVALTDRLAATWRWEPARQRWLRTDGDTPVVVADGRPIAVGTVVVVEVPTRPRPAVVADLVGEGPAVVLVDGRRHGARWSRSDPGRPPGVVRRDGTVVRLTDDRAWVQLCAGGCARRLAPPRAP